MRETKCEHIYHCSAKFCAKMSVFHINICCSDRQFESGFRVNRASYITTLFPVEFQWNFINENTKIAHATELLVMLDSKWLKKQNNTARLKQNKTEHLQTSSSEWCIMIIHITTSVHILSPYWPSRQISYGSITFTNTPIFTELWE